MWKQNQEYSSIINDSIIKPDLFQFQKVLSKYEDRHKRENLLNMAFIFSLVLSTRHRNNLHTFKMNSSNILFYFD